MGDGTTPIRELAGLFLRLGLTAFGGPAAHIAMMHAEVVERRKWLSQGEFLDLLAVTNLIPGPNSTELAIHIGYRQAGMKGLLVAGTCFILPAAMLCCLIAAIYVAWGKLPVTVGILYGVKPVVIAIVAQALWRLAQGMIKQQGLLVLAVIAGVINFRFGHELLVLFGAGFLVLFLKAREFRIYRPVLFPPFIGEISATTKATTIAATTTAAIVAAPLWQLFLVFLKIGSVLFGSGYVLLAFLQADLVDRHHWLTQQQLLDAVAVGQITPGPVFTTATFIGYVIGGPAGALVATLGIFLPAFFFVAVTAPFLKSLRESKLAAAFLDGLNAASLGLMAAVTVNLTRAAVVDALTLGLAVLSLGVLIWKPKLNSAWLVLAGGLVGILMVYWRGMQ
jgi:chromate transporter